MSFFKILVFRSISEYFLELPKRQPKIPFSTQKARVFLFPGLYIIISFSFVYPFVTVAHLFYQCNVPKNGEKIIGQNENRRNDIIFFF